MDDSWFWEDMEVKTKDAVEVQARLLQKIMEMNAGTEYLKRHGAEEGTPASFSKLPLVTYEDIEEDIQRIANGDTSPIISAEPVCQIFTSSGTSTGTPKLLPATIKSLELLFRRFVDLCESLNHFVLYFCRPVGLAEADVCLGFIFAKAPSTTKGGLQLSTTSSTFLNYKGLNLADKFTGPPAVMLAPDISQSVYCHLLCGLIRSRQVTTLYAALAKMLVDALLVLEEAWQELAADIKTGTLSKRITDSELRKALSPLLQPDPELSSTICEECSAENAWTGILKRLWPNLKSITTVTTGAMLLYVPALRKYGGTLPIQSGDYVSTECVIGFNQEPTCPAEKVSFTIHPDYAYYEFLPCTAKASECTPVGLADVEVGETYELVVTTWSGLYRYKLGDVVRVTGFYNLSPKIAFLHRFSSILDIAGERTTEDELQNAIQSSLGLLPETEELVDFTSCRERSTVPGRYVVFWELKGGNKLNTVAIQKCCYELEVGLNDRYRQARVRGLIGPLKLCIVQSKTFKTLLQYSLSRGTSATQYKTPRCITNPEMIAILMGNVTQRCLIPQDSA